MLILEKTGSGPEGRREPVLPLLGYREKTAWSKGGCSLLALHAPPMKRLLGPEGVAEIGFADL
jgi:hypothetical protein